MRPTIDFKECLKDSPKFRASLEEAETDIETLEAKLEKLVKLCTTMIDTGKAFSSAGSGFVVGVREMSSYFKDDDLVNACLNRFAHAMTEMLKYFTILMDQAHRSVCKNLNNFIKNDIKKVKEAKKHFEKISDDMDSCLLRNSQAIRSKPQECEEVTNVLMAMRSCFAHTSLDYVFQINILHSKKRFEVLGTMLSFVHAQSTFFHQGHELCKDFEPYMKDVASQVEELSAKAAVERKEMEERHTLVQKKDLSVSATIPEDNGSEGSPELIPEGYLFKRTTNAFKTWVRRWFMIQDSQLVYQKRAKDVRPTVMEKDLRLCSVKPVYDFDRRFCFEVVSPAGSHMLQGESDQECIWWITALQDSVTQAFRDAEKVKDIDEEVAEDSFGASNSIDMSNLASPQQVNKQTKVQLRLEQLFSIPGNDRCCDCGSPEPRWTSINLGITLCIECSGIHRSFGVHMSKVRSITLDAWEPELIKVFTELGNDVINRIYEANVNESVATKATPDCKRSIRESWIRAKYVQKAFVAHLPGPKTSSGSKIKGWSVRKKTKRSPARQLIKEEIQESSDQEDVTSGLMEAVLSVSNAKDSDSGLGASASDVIVFGTDIEFSDINRSIELESSEDSSTEQEDADDTNSTTSWEDMSKLDPNLLLYKAAQARNLSVMLEALANGADPNWVNVDEDGKTPIMKAVETGSQATCEFLLLNGAKLDRKDKKGRTPLHHATILGHTAQVCQFLKRGANLSEKDADGLDALTIAVNATNADIVTLLRLAKLNEEMKEDVDYGHGAPGDETFSSVLGDFTNMASHNPEKLRRNQSQPTFSKLHK